MTTAITSLWSGSGSHARTAGTAVQTALLLMMVGLSCVGSTAAGLQPSLRLTRVATGLSNPIYATHAPGDASRLFIAEQGGNIRILDLNTGLLNATPFLTTAQLGTGTGFTSGGERGLLGLAFDPGYNTNGRFFVNYTDLSGNTRIRSFTRDPGNPNLATTTGVANILSITQPFTNHNGGWMSFGPDGFLYVATGDGGSGNDPNNSALDRSNLLGKMLRIDPDRTNAGGYTSPSSNPFFNDGNNATRDEIWAYGLRNPWRNGFDRLTGDLYIADVGQSQLEEINFQSANSGGGENYGWRVREGTQNTGLTNGGLTGLGPAIDPIHDYAHSSNPFEGFSVTGGTVYRGPVAGLQGQYFFGDYVSRRLFSLEFDGSDPTSFDGTNYRNLIDWTDIVTFENGLGSLGSISSFGEDFNGNLYLINHGGQIFRFSAGAIPEPASLGVLLFASISLLASGRRRRG